MRRRRRENSNILIDLTSLLDVIFILLMVVLARQQISGMNLEKKAADLSVREEELSEAKREAEDKFRLYSDQTDTLNKAVMISVTATFDEDDIQNRDLKILKNGNPEPDVFLLSGGDTAETYSEFEEKRRSYVEGASEGMPVILSIADDGSEILYRDQQKIQALFNELQEGSSDIYIRGIE